MVKKLKCWKKVGKLRWKNKSKKGVFIDIGKTAFNDYSVDKQSNHILKPIHDKFFLNKKEAKSFAVKYMEKHDKC